MTDLENLMPGANKNAAPLRLVEVRGVPDVNTKCLNTNQIVYFFIANIFIETIVFILHTVGSRKLGILYNSLTYNTKYPIYTLEFYKREIDNKIV